MRVLPTEWDDRFAKNFEQRIKVGAFDRKLRVEPTSNLACRGLTIHRATAKPAEIIDHELSDRISPFTYLVGRRLKHVHVLHAQRISCANCAGSARRVLLVTRH